MGLYNDLTLQDSQYIPQYTGLPLDTIRDVSDTLAERHYQNLARMDALDLLARQQKTQVLPGDQWYVDKQIGDIRSALGELAQGGAENASARVSAMVNQFRGDENILTSLQRAGEVNKEIETEAQLRAQGRTPVRREGLREQYQAGAIDRETGRVRDQFRTPYQSTAEAFLSPTPEMEEIWKVVNPDSWYTNLQADEKTRISKLIGEGKISPNMDMPLFFKVLRGEGISTDKISSMLDNAFSSYKNQASYRQQTGVLGRSDDELKSDMLKQGMLRVFSKVDPQYIQNSTADDILRGSLKKQEGVLPAESVAGEPIQNLLGYAPGDFRPRNKGEEIAVIDEKDGLSAYVNNPDYEVRPLPTREGGTQRYSVKTMKDGVIPDGIGKERFQADAIEISKASGVQLPENKKDWKPEDWNRASDLMRAYEETYKNRIVSPYKYPYDNDMARERSGQIHRSITHRTLYDPDTKEKIVVRDNKGWNADFAESIADPEKVIATGRLSSKNPFIRDAGPEFANAEYIQIWDPKNDTWKNYLATPAAGELESAEGNLARNAGIIYDQVSLKPGIWNKVTPSVYGQGGRVIPIPPIEAKELIGNELATKMSTLSPEELAAVRAHGGKIITAMIKGQPMDFVSEEHLANYLITNP